MEYFKQYVSNTLAGSSNQLFFESNDEVVHTGRMYYKIFQGGLWEYSLLFSNIIDSTYAEGKDSHCNLLCDEWTILSLKAGKVSCCGIEEACEPESFTEVTFEGKSEKKVMPGEFFTSDCFVMDIPSGEYLCLEITFKGQRIPYHEEIKIPVFVQEEGTWVPSPKLPVPGMVGCRREVPLKIGFLGDSITQGIGATPNSYAHWNALVAEGIGKQYSYWNLGIGYGRAQDMASGGSWLFKAGQMDVIVLCAGINDIGRRPENEAIKKDLKHVIDTLHAHNIKVIIQTMPPFYEEENEKSCRWLELNDYIRTELSQVADGFFDVAPLLGKDPQRPYLHGYGAHPNDQGSAIWAEGLTEYLQKWLENI